jgi:hypothetical protein
VIMLPLLISAGGGPAENRDVTIETLNATRGIEGLSSHMTRRWRGQSTANSSLK